MPVQGRALCGKEKSYAAGRREASTQTLCPVYTGNGEEGSITPFARDAPEAEGGKPGQNLRRRNGLSPGTGQAGCGIGLKGGSECIRKSSWSGCWKS